MRIRQAAMGLVGAGTVLAGMVAPAALAGASANGIASLSEPTARYEHATCVVAVGSIADGTKFGSLNQCGETYTFNHVVEKASVRPGGTWATWGSPPFTEGSTPGLIENDAATLTINLSAAKRAVGMEIEGNIPSVHTITVRYWHGGASIVGIARQVDGDAGARLFAVETTSPTATINKVTISIAGDHVFAIAKLRVG